MVRIMICGIASCLMLSPAQGQRSQIPELTQEQADSRTVIGVMNEYLAAGAEAIRVKQYDEGIRLTKIGLDRPASPRDRSAALSNLCAAHAAKNEPDLAIGYCNESHRDQRHELARVQQPRLCVLLEAHVRRSRCGSRRGAVDQPERQADAADPRHDERTPSARAGHDRGAPTSRVASPSRRGNRRRGVSRSPPRRETPRATPSTPSAPGAASCGATPTSATSACYSISRRRVLRGWRASRPWPCRRGPSSRRGSRRIARCGSAIHAPDGSTRPTCVATLWAAPGER